MKIHHIGYLVSSIEESLIEFQKLGYIKISEPIFDGARLINICFVQNQDQLIELVSPVGDKSVVHKLFRKIRSAPYHICYESENIEEEIKDLCSQGYTVIHDLLPAIALGNRRVAFLYSINIGLIEIVDSTLN